MTAERWRLVEEVFHEAIALPAAARDAFLAERCAADRELELDVRRMLVADSPGANTFENLISDSVSEWLDKPAAGVPDRVGAWRIVKPLGAGGMGTVYLASRDDEAYRQLAAVKILRAEQFAPGLHDRFRQERQILAELEHPNIARLLDGGSTPDGRPYLVIEYVDGVPLTQYAANLTIRERCVLFATVCDAVAYAHRNLIVHRDIKPANILVDAHGVPKLLDFGIAKLIGVDHGMTSSMHALFTPDYASPEQVLGQPITTATDVYALGAVLFEILTGRPVRSGANRSFAEIVKDVTDGAIPAPSRATTLHIPLDLDRIVEKALDPEPARRYGSADQLAADLRRFLDGHPVEARGHSWLYTTSKFARRQWLPLTALALLLTALAASTVWSLRQARIAEAAQAQAEQAKAQADQARARAEAALTESDRQRARAEHSATEAAQQRAVALDRFHSARKLTHKFLFDIEDALKDTVGATKARQVLVATALEHFEQMGKQIDNDPALMRDLARAYDRIGDVQGYSGAANLGDYHGAVASYRKSLEWHRKLGGVYEDRLAAVDVAVKLAKLQKWIGQIPEAEATFARTDKDMAALQAITPAGKQNLFLLYRSNLYRAWTEHMQVLEQHEKVRELLGPFIGVMQRAIAQDPANNRLRLALVADTINLSRTLQALQDWREAVRVGEIGLSVTRDVLGPKPALRDQARLLPPAIQLTEILQRAPEPHKNIARAIAIDQEMIAIGEKLVALDAANARNQFMLSNLISGYGEHLRAAWRWPEALAAYQRSVDISEALLKKSPNNGYYQDMLASDLVLIGQLQFDMQQDAAARANLERAVTLLDKSIAASRLFMKPYLDTAREILARLK